MKLTKLIMLGALSLAGLAVQAQQATVRPDPAKGQAAAAICAGCHGVDGNSLAPTFPKIAGQHYDYLVKQLHDYRVRTGDTAPLRPNAIMQGIASQLTEEQIRDLSGYFAAQVQQPGVARNKDTVELGQAIWRGGIADKGVPACAGCHGPAGSGIPGQYPRLGGQWAEYTEAQLTAFRSGVRKNNQAMTDISSRLSDAEIRAVSDYIAGLR